MTATTLSDGITVETSDRGQTGYLGACFSPSWTLNENKPFIAATSQPTDPTILEHVTAKDRTALHLGYYSDPREAAYVVGMYHNDPIGTIDQIENFGPIDVFPKDLYTLKVNFTKFDAQKVISRYKKNRVAKIDNRPVDNNVKYIVDTHKVSLFDLAKVFSKTTVLHDRKILTVNEFELRYGLGV